MKRGTIPLLVGGIFTLVGAGFLLVAIIIAANSMSFLAGAERTDGIVVDLTERTSTNRDSDGHRRRRTTWYPTVEFTTTDGETVSFDESTGSNPPASDVGDEVPVAYDPDHPSDARVATFGSLYLLPLIFGGVGVVFTPIGAVLLIVGIRKRSSQARLLRDGTEVWAEISHVGVVRNIRLNRRHPYVVHAAWRDPSTGRTHRARSDYLIHDPGPQLLGRTRVRVLYNPDNPDDNVMDLAPGTPRS